MFQLLIDDGRYAACEVKGGTPHVNEEYKVLFRRKEFSKNFNSYLRNTDNTDYIFEYKLHCKSNKAILNQAHALS